MCGLSHWVRDRVAVRVRHSVLIVATVLTVVSAVLGRPRLVVQRAVETLGDTIFGKYVRVEEDLKHD